MCRRTVVIVQGCGSSRGAREQLALIAARALATRESVLCATSFPAPEDALREVQVVAGWSLEQSWRDAERVFSALLDCGRCHECQGPLVACVSSALAEEAQWLRALVMLADSHLVKGSSLLECRDAVLALRAAFAVSG